MCLNNHCNHMSNGCTSIFFMLVCLIGIFAESAYGQAPQDVRRRRTVQKPSSIQTQKPAPAPQKAAPPVEASVVSGRVYDAETGEALIGASVQTVGQSYGAYADENGRFKFRLPENAPDTVDVEVYYVGYGRRRFSVPKNGGVIDGALTLEAVTLDATVVITASRVPQRILDAPVTISVVTAKDIEDRIQPYLSDLFRDNVEYKVDQSVDPYSYNAVTTRGIRGMERFILMQDGLRISSPTNEPLMVAENMPLYMVKQVEMVSSSASALYGADALAGVVNLVTYKPEEINGVRAGVRSGMYDYYSGHLLFGKKLGKVGLRLGANYFYDGNYALPRFYRKEFEGLNEYASGTFSTMFGPMTPSTPFNPRYEFRRTGYSLDALVTYEDWNFNVSRHSARHPTATGYFPTNAIYNHSAFYEQSVTKISATYNKKVSDRMDLQTLMMTSIYELNSQSNFRNVYSGMEPGYKFGFGSMGFFEQTVNYTLPKWKLTGGLVYQPYFSTPKGEDLDRPVDVTRTIQANILGSDIRAEYFSLRYDNFGAFGQAIFKPTEKWALTAGARYDYNTRYFSAFNPRAGIVFNPTDGAALKLFYGSSFYAPSPLDAYDQYGSFIVVQNQAGQDSSWKSFFRHLANPGLKPIYNRNLEFNYTHNIGDFRLALTGYVMFLENLYYESNDATTLNLYNGRDRGYSVDYIEVRVNNGKQINYGGHLDLQYRAKLGAKARLTAFARFGFLDGEQEFFGVKQNIPYISQFQQRTGLLFVYDKFSAYASLMAMSEQRTVVPNPEDSYRHLTLPGYHTLDVNFSYKILPYLRLFVEFENLTNQKFYHPNRFATPSDFFGVPQMPFRFFGGANLNLNFKDKQR